MRWQKVLRLRTYAVTFGDFDLHFLGIALFPPFKVFFLIAPINLNQAPLTSSPPFCQYGVAASAFCGSCQDHIAAAAAATPLPASSNRPFFWRKVSAIRRASERADQLQCLQCVKILLPVQLYDDSNGCFQLRSLSSEGGKMWTRLFKREKKNQPEESKQGC